LHGLEKTNSNALARTIVFHSWEAITDDEIYSKEAKEGWGCPAISNNSFVIVDPNIKRRLKTCIDVDTQIKSDL
jgi:L,D-transpeptidase catalytic domain